VQGHESTVVIGHGLLGVGDPAGGSGWQ
jgi:hypothetical protein